jgi:hypothetical protein
MAVACSGSSAWTRRAASSTIGGQQLAADEMIRSPASVIEESRFHTGSHRGRSGPVRG